MEVTVAYFIVLSMDFAECSENNQKIPYSGESKSRCPVLFPEDGTDKLSPNDRKKLPADAA
jgi:hypothetical protein